MKKKDKIIEKNNKKVMERKQISEKSKNIMFSIVVFICICLYSIAIAPRTLQNDTFYTIKIGEYISQNGIFNLTEDIYSWHELPYTYPHWLYDLIMFYVFNLGGQLGIYISTIFLTAVLGLSIYINCKNKSKNYLLSFIFTIIAMYLLKSYIAARAQLVTFFLFSFTVYFIEKFLNTHKKRYAIPLIIIPILITNLHCAVFPFYFILYLPYIAEYLWALILEWNLDYRLLRIALKIIMRFVPSDETYEKIQKKIDNIPDAIEKQKEKRKITSQNPYKIKLEKNPYIKWLFIIMVITAFTGFLNPTGTGAYTYTYKIYQGNTTGSINEHLPLTLIDNKQYLFGIALFLVILLFTQVKIKLSDLFMVSGLVLLSLMSRRQVSMALIFCVPILVKIITDFIEMYDYNAYQKIFKVASTYTCGVIIILFFAIFTTHEIRENVKKDYIDQTSYPIDTASWITQNLNTDEIKIYNEYNYGSYLLFRGIPVFIDSRCDLYTPEFNGGKDIFSDALNIASISANYDSLFDSYNVTHLVIPTNGKLFMLVSKQKNYKLLHQDYAFAVYERVKVEEKQENVDENKDKNIKEEL